MSKKIIIFNGSPRKNGNTETMANAFMEEAENNGHIVTKCDIARMNFKGCNACDKCFTKDNKPCIQDDDFNSLVPVIYDSDVLIFSFPLYWFSTPAQLKLLIDKFHALAFKEGMANKEYGIISACAKPTTEFFQGVQYQLKQTSTLFDNWTKLGEVLIPGVVAVGDINNTNGVEKARELAKKL